MRNHARVRPLGQVVLLPRDKNRLHNVPILRAKYQRAASVSLVDRRYLPVGVAQSDSNIRRRFAGQDDGVRVGPSTFSDLRGAARLPDADPGPRLNDLVLGWIDVEIDRAGAGFGSAVVEAPILEIEMHPVHIAVFLAVEEGIEPAAGQQVGTKHAIERRLFVGGDIQHQPLQIGPHQFHFFAGGNLGDRNADLVDREHWNGNCSTDAPYGLARDVVVVVLVEQAVAVAVQPDLDCQLLGDDTDLSTGVEEEIALSANTVVRGNDGQERNVGPDGRLTVNQVVQRIKGQPVVHRKRIAMVLAGRHVLAEVDLHVEIVHPSPATGPAGHIQGRHLACHCRHTGKSPGPEHAEVVVGIGLDAGIEKGVADSAAAGEIEAVIHGDVHKVRPRDTHLFERALRLVRHGRLFHVADGRCHRQHAIRAGIEQEGIEDTWSDARPSRTRSKTEVDHFESHEGNLAVRPTHVLQVDVQLAIGDIYRIAFDHYLAGVCIDPWMSRGALLLEPYGHIVVVAGQIAEVYLHLVGTIGKRAAERRLRRGYRNKISVQGRSATPVGAFQGRRPRLPSGCSIERFRGRRREPRFRRRCVRSKVVAIGCGPRVLDQFNGHAGLVQGDVVRRSQLNGASR